MGQEEMMVARQIAAATYRRNVFSVVSNGSEMPGHDF
jgi:hypothetical protein